MLNNLTCKVSHFYRNHNNMQYKFTIAEKADNYKNLVLIYDSADEIDWSYFSNEQRNWIQTKIENKDRFIAVNHFSYFIFIILASNDSQEYLKIEDIRKSGNLLNAYIKSEKINTIQVCGKETFVYACIEGIVLGLYAFDKYLKDKNKSKIDLQEIFIISDGFTTSKLNVLENLLDAVCLARDMVNEPACALNSLQLADWFVRLGCEAGFDADVFHKEKIEELGFTGLLGVNQGSFVPPTFTVMEWKPTDAINTKPYVLVGKGITYDTGGYNIKTGSFMQDMKSDMGGAAAVAGLMYVLAKCKMPLYVVALVPSTDNRVNDRALVSGDVIRYANGVTVEVGNTDAEGRLILADALCYAKKFEPELVIDLATLTGAAVRALGSKAISAMGNASDEIFDDLAHSGFRTFERLHRFPLWSDYKDYIKSNIADISNSSVPLAGMITGGIFLEHFVDYPWCHLDIAATAFLSKEESYRKKDGTGSGIRLLFDFFTALIKKHNC